MTKQRVSEVSGNRGLTVDRADHGLLLGGNISMGVILTSVGKEHRAHARLLVGLSVWAVVMSWFILHTAFGQHYARLMIKTWSARAVPVPRGCAGVLNFPGVICLLTWTLCTSLLPLASPTP